MWGFQSNELILNDFKYRYLLFQKPKQALFLLKIKDIKTTSITFTPNSTR